MEHLFFLCPLARAVWFGTDLSIRTEYFALSCIKDWIYEWLSKPEFSGLNALWFYGQFVSILWSLWKHRNSVIFQNQTPNPCEIIPKKKCLLRWITMAFQNDTITHLTRSPSSSGFEPSKATTKYQPTKRKRQNWTVVS
ncbi:hypothetical protein CRYUN_Cryun22dG0048300 [Craigia yunnanensis]